MREYDDSDIVTAVISFQFCDLAIQPLKIPAVRLVVAVYIPTLNPIEVIYAKADIVVIRGGTFENRLQPRITVLVPGTRYARRSSRTNKPSDGSS